MLTMAIPWNRDWQLRSAAVRSMLSRGWVSIWETPVKIENTKKKEKWKKYLSQF
jgi:hypothetical protein